jgi:serine/threonine-protein kinase
MTDRLADGRYEVVRRLAAGGMGEVLLAEFAGDADVSPGLLVVKRCLGGVAGERPAPQSLRMLREEARLGMRLRHENIVETLRLEEDGGDPLLVMELLAGRSMGQVLAQAKKRKERVPIDVALAVLRGAACGLHFAHTLTGPGGKALGLVHRDISPANIFVTFDQHVKVIDFGVAKSVDSEIKTSTGVLKGKLGYMSPEQALGEGTLTAQADVWSLGVFFWEMLLAERLFHSPNPTATLMQISSRELHAPSTIRPDVPRVVDELCMKMLTRPLDQRFASCAALVQAIDALPGGGGVAGVHVGEWLAGRFPEEAEAGARDAARCARRLRALPVPRDIVDGASAVLPDDDADTGLQLSRSAFGTPTTESGGLPVESSEPDLATVRLSAHLVEDLRRASRIGNDDLNAPTERVSPESVALARRLAAEDSTAPGQPVPSDLLRSLSAVPSGPPRVPAAALEPREGAPASSPAFARPPPMMPAGRPPTQPPAAPTSTGAGAAEAASRMLEATTGASRVQAAPGPFPAPNPTTAPPMPALTPRTQPPSLPSSTPAAANAFEPQETAWVSIAVSTFGALVLAIGFVFALLAPPPTPHYYAYSDPGGFDVVVGDREHVPPGLPVRDLVPQNSPVLWRAGAVGPLPVAVDDLQRRLDDAGISARARVPETSRGRLAVAMPVLIVSLGVLSLAFALPGVVVRSRGRRIAAHAAFLVVAVMLIVALAQFGGLGWPGRTVIESAPRLEWR